MKTKNKVIIILFLVFSQLNLFSQNFSLIGDVFNDKGEPLAFSSVVLLNPSDSTMEFFGITNSEGHFSIKNIDEGKFLLQVAYLGHNTFSKGIEFPRENGNNIGIIALKKKDISLDEIIVSAEKVPFLINKDTIEFNLSSFKIKPNAVTEDLLKKLPGIEIDRSGNIKALGEDIDRLLVDGKEFFGNDPKVATRNIPANALGKIQVYDRQSDESEFTGMDDGIRDKTLNLVLKDNHKNAVFGNVLAGGGYPDYYKSSAKVYRFTDNVQLAALGMINNVNQFGFSFSDYMNFNGGLGGLGAGQGMSKIRIDTENSFPINFGQPVSGELQSTAGGFNLSKSKGRNDRIFMSYLLNTSDKILEQNSNTTHYLEYSEYLQKEDLNQDLQNAAHRLNFGIKKRVHDNHNLILNAEAALTSKDIRQLVETNSLSNQMIINSLESNNADESNKKAVFANGSYIVKAKSGKSILKIRGSGMYSNEVNNLNYKSNTVFYENNFVEVNSQYQKNNTTISRYNGTLIYAQGITKHIFSELKFNVGKSHEKLTRSHSYPLMSDAFVDSLSPVINKDYFLYKPGFNIKRNTEKMKILLGFDLEAGYLTSFMHNSEIKNIEKVYLLPNLSYEWRYKTGRRINFSYISMVNTPTVNQLIPIKNILNPLSYYQGNPELSAEYVKNSSLSWWIFDQFSFTTLFTTLSFEQTNNKIGWSHTIDENLARYSTLVNVDNEFETRWNADFSTPIRKFGLKVNLSVEQSLSLGESFVNDIINENTQYAQRFSFNLENRKKKRWDLISGVGLSITDSKYSVQNSLDNSYTNISWFGEIGYFPNEKWNFELIADVTNYTAESFESNMIVPLLTAEINYNFLKFNRGALTLSIYDILNRNTIIQRTSELNYLREIQSNTIGRYFLLTFTYQLNKFGSRNGGVDVEVKNR
jgi:Outer membrane protein beta-barrel family/CarboxypepD_reg-like domain